MRIAGAILLSALAALALSGSHAALRGRGAGEPDAADDTNNDNHALAGPWRGVTGPEAAEVTLHDHEAELALKVAARQQAEMSESLEELEQVRAEAAAQERAVMQQRMHAEVESQRRREEESHKQAHAAAELLDSLQHVPVDEHPLTRVDDGSEPAPTDAAQHGKHAEHDKHGHGASRSDSAAEDALTGPAVDIRNAVARVRGEPDSATEREVEAAVAKLDEADAKRGKLLDLAKRKCHEQLEEMLLQFYQLVAHVNEAQFDAELSWLTRAQAEERALKSGAIVREPRIGVDMTYQSYKFVRVAQEVYRAAFAARGASARLDNLQWQAEQALALAGAQQERCQRLHTDGARALAGDCAALLGDDAGCPGTALVAKHVRTHTRTETHTVTASVHEAASVHGLPVAAAEAEAEAEAQDDMPAETAEMAQPAELDVSAEEAEALAALQAQAQAQAMLQGQMGEVPPFVMFG